mmetsp:Transcript_14469/g.31390  ORF Transcript_14469/g.31390 Transcript_14469/m.31390 type:complete len:252 (+) Transcript_14469:4679-5434(+)
MAEVAAGDGVMSGVELVGARVTSCAPNSHSLVAVPCSNAAGVSQEVGAQQRVLCRHHVVHHALALMVKQHGAVVGHSGAVGVGLRLEVVVLVHHKIISADLHGGCHIPDDGLPAADRGEARGVLVEHHLADGAGVVAQLTQHLRSLQVVEHGGAHQRADRQQLADEVKRAAGGRAVSLQHSKDRARGGIPHQHAAVRATARNQLAVGRPHEAGDAGNVVAQHKLGFAAGGVDLVKQQLAVCAAARETLVIW